MRLAQKALYTLAGLVAAILQLLFEAAFGPGQARKASKRGHRIGNATHGRSQPRETREQDSLSVEALVRLCRGLQEEVRRKEGELTTCKADVKLLRLERRRVAQERKQEAQQKELLWQQLKFETDERAEIDREHGNMVAAMQKELTYAEHAKGAFQAQVHQLERDVSNLRSELASRGSDESEMWRERSELIDDKARLGRQIIELSKRAQQAEADLATSRATARALASNNAELQEQVALESSAHAKLEQRADELAGKLAATKAELDQEVEDLRDVLNATLEDKAALASQCSALEAQANYMEADSMQLRAWLEEVIQANDALESRVEALEAAAATAHHEKAALEGWVRGSVEEQTAASSRLASFQALSRGLEKDGVCKSALIGVLAIHLVQRERQLSQLLRSSAPDCVLTLQSSNGLTMKGDTAEASLATPALMKQHGQEVILESAAGHEPTTPSRFAFPAPGMASASTSGHSSPCNGSIEEPAQPSSQPSPSAISPAQLSPPGASAALPRPSTAPSRSSSGERLPARIVPPGGADIGSIRRAASSAAAQIPLPRELLLLSRARSALPPHADRSAHVLWQERLEHHLRSRGSPGCPERPARARAQSGPLQGTPQMLGDLAGPSALPNLAQPPPKAFTKGPQVLATA